MTEEIPTGEKTTVPASELEDLLDTLRTMQNQRQESAKEATTAQSRKYNQGGAFAYCISANSLEQLIDKHDPKQ